MPGLIGMVALALAYALLSRVRKHESLQIVVITAITVAIAAAVYDYGASQGWLPEATMLALNWAGPLLLAALATPVVDRFVRVLREAEGARGDLESRVREREQMLKRNYERLREGERLQATAAERQRIMQDMHDGLGHAAGQLADAGRARRADPGAGGADPARIDRRHAAGDRRAGARATPTCWPRSATCATGWSRDSAPPASS